MATRDRRMPISAAVSGSSAVLRIATPQSEYLNAAAKTAMKRIAVTAAATRVCWTVTPSSSVVSLPHGAPTSGSVSAPTRRVELRREHDVEADRDDRQRVYAAASSSQRPDHQQVQQRGEDAAGDGGDADGQQER